MYRLLVLNLLVVALSEANAASDYVKEANKYDDLSEEPNIGDIFDVKNTTKTTNETVSSTQKPLGSEVNLQSSQTQAVSIQSINATARPASPPILKDFRPSPQLETYYEYNREPVVPAHGEAKSFIGMGLVTRLPHAPWLKFKHYFTPEHEGESGEEGHRGRTGLGSYGEGGKIGDVKGYGGGPKYSELLGQRQLDTKIRFPTPTPSTLPKIYPYQYLPPNEPFPTLDIPAQRKPDVVEDITHKTVSAKPITVHDGYGVPNRPKADGHVETDNINHGLSSSSPPFYAHAPGEGFVKPSFSYTFPSSVEKYEKESYYKKPVYEEIHQPELSSPKGSSHVLLWKKVVKFLTAIIPFGLLLSALTPTVISVGPEQVAPTGGVASYGAATETNRFPGTGRAAKSTLEVLHNLSKGGCEERILCELLLNAGSSQNAQQHIENLIDTFIGEGKNTEGQKAEINRIFKAVKTESCKSLPCKQIKERSAKIDFKQE